MYQRKINLLLVLFSLIGGAAGFAAGELLLSFWEGELPYALLMGLYFGIFALIVGLACLLAELISPELNGRGWRLRYIRESFKLLVPAALVMLFVAGALLQLIYGLGFGKVRPPDNIVLAIDVSGSMKETDPDRESFRAATELISRLKTGKRISVIVFNEEPSVLQPMIALDSGAVRQELAAKLAAYESPDGQTDIRKALDLAAEEIRTAARPDRSMVILISDGYSNVDSEDALSYYKDESIAINTIGVAPSDKQGNDLLRRLAEDTGGSFHSVDNVALLSSIFNEIYRVNQNWHLVGERTGAALDSPWYMFLRLLFLTVVGLLLGLSLGIIFDNRFLARSFASGGAAAGLAAGLILELGLRDTSVPAWWIRAIAAMVLALILSLSTGLIRYKRNKSEEPGDSSRRQNGRSGSPYGRDSASGNSFQ